jgi:high affinity sulfate transporter 1
MSELRPVDQPENAQPPSGDPNRAAAAAPADSRHSPRGLAGWVMLRSYRPAWLVHDLAAGLVLTAVLVPVGMGYAEASGLPAIHGLYATILPLLVYALFGPSRILVLGPDSTLSAVIAALILPLAAGRPERAVALAGMLALLSGACSMLIGFLRLGLLADLLSKPIRIGFMNAIALTVLIGQLPKIFGVPGSAPGQGLMDQSAALVSAVLNGQTNSMSLLIGAGCLTLILLLKRYRQPWPGILLAVALATVASAGLGLAQTSGIAVLGALPQGLPQLQIPQVTWPDIVQLLPGAVMISLLSFADSSVLSRSLAQRGGYHVSQNQEMIALGGANIAAGLFQGFSVSSSASRTPVAEAAGAKTQVTGLVGAAAIAALLVWAPTLLSDLPSAALGAVVIAACLSFADLPGMWALWRLRPVEFALSVCSFVGVAFIGVIEGIFITVSLALLMLVWNAWHPYFAVLARVNGRKGYHDASRHPEGRQIPGLVLFRWDAQLFFANAEIFREQVHRAVDRAPTPTRRVVVAAEAISDVDITAADMLCVLYGELQQRGIELWFAGLKGPVKDRLNHLGTLALIGQGAFSPTVGHAVTLYREAYDVDWKDWDEP